jgi:hypothetical protein
MRQALRRLMNWFGGGDPNLQSRQVRRQEERVEAKIQVRKRKQNTRYDDRSRWRYIVEMSRTSWRGTKNALLWKAGRKERNRAWKRIWKGITHANV